MAEGEGGISRVFDALLPAVLTSNSSKLGLMLRSSFAEPSAGMAAYGLFRKSFLGASTCESFRSTEPTVRIAFGAAPWVQIPAHPTNLIARRQRAIKFGGEGG